MSFFKRNLLKYSPSSRSVFYRVKAFFSNVFIGKSVGHRTYVDPTVHVLHWSDVSIGSDCILSQDVWINVNHSNNEFRSLEIGSYGFIGRRNFFSSGKQIVLKDFCMTGCDCHFLGSDHNFQDPYSAYISTGTTKTNTIKVGVNCWLGAGVTIMGNVTVGYGSIIGTRSLVISDIPPFSIAVGSPARVIKRFDFQRNEWVKISEYTEANEALMPGEDEYHKILMEKSSEINMPWRAAGKSMGDLF